MAINDPVSDLLTRIRNGCAAKLKQLTMPDSHLRAQVCDVLKREGYIRDYRTTDVRPGVKELTVELKYHEGEPVIQRAVRISKPGRRIYAPIDTLPRVFNGMGIAILSTSRGILSDSEARVQNVGGEVLCEIL
jgi:small subunit ribosomal protein S8